MNREEFIKKIPSINEGYLVLSNLTRSPYIECNTETFDDEVFFFTDVKEAGKKVSELNEDGKNTAILKVENKRLLGMLTNLFFYNVNAIRIQTKSDVFHYQLTEIVRRKDVNELPPEKRPVENPSLQLSMLYFMQEVRAKKEDKDMGHIREMEEEMLVNLTRGRYLMPFKETEADGRKVSQIMCVKLSDEKFYMPVFTDIMEFQKFRKQDQELKLNAVDFKFLQKMELPPQANGFVVNPAGVAAAFPLALVRKLPTDV
ncbi:MAG: SseB family protein [Lachnospiraceae bacterium]